MLILKDPFIRFLVLGAVIFVLFDVSRSPGSAAAQKQIILDGSTLNWVYSNFTKQFRRPPSSSEMDALVSSYITNEVKYRESLALGLDQKDSIVRRRMMQKFDFLFGSDAAEDRPDEAALQAWYEDNAPRFEVPGTVTFSHLFFDQDKRGKSARLDAQERMKQLTSQDRPQADLFPFKNRYETATPAMVRRVFGEAFTDDVFSLEGSDWQGPILSGLGVHLVHIETMTEPSLLPLEEVRDYVMREWRSAENHARLEERLMSLKQNYQIVVDEEALKGFEYVSEADGES